MSKVTAPGAQPLIPKSTLIEVAWEVCNQVGGIYTVIRSKIPAMMASRNDAYFLIGPYLSRSVMAELELLDETSDPVGLTVQHLREQGIEIYYAQWLVTGRPRVVLINPQVLATGQTDIYKYSLWKDHSIETPGGHPLVDQVVAFGYLTALFMETYRLFEEKRKRIITHFHEWMAGIPILEIKRKKLSIKTVFTTHATQLGRHLAINSPQFYDHLPFFQWKDEAKKFGIEAEASIEFACANQADVFTTVSDVTARECKHLLKRKPDAILPNGLNIERFVALHEFQNLHAEYKQKIHEFTMAHFFQSYTFDLDKTVYFFTSGRYEYKNKGFDLTLEALHLLNKRLKKEQTDATVVMFFVTKREYHNIRADLLQSRAMMEEIRRTCDVIQKQVGNGLFFAGTVQDQQRFPDLNNFVDEYWKLRFRRSIQSWKNNKLPLICTHKLRHEEQDEILRAATERKLVNDVSDRVKIVYHPDFISTMNPLFGMEYNQFVRGCHLGIFPSYYEPWGYTPLECMASGVPSVTSDLSGFGDYLLQHMPDHDAYGLYVVERGKRSFDWSAGQLADILYNFLQLTRRERITQRNQVENHSAVFDWQNLITHYIDAYRMAVQPQREV